MKEFKTKQDQIDYLRDKKRIITSEPFSRVFDERNYVSIINPYKEFFSCGKNENNEHMYKRNVQLEELIKIAKTDDQFRFLLHKQICFFETKLKLAIFYTICKTYNYDLEDCDNAEYKGKPIDRYCLEYIGEIEYFFLDPGKNQPPRFCQNILFQLSRGKYIDANESEINARYSVLCNIASFGKGIKSDGTPISYDNELLSHYRNDQGLIPLWVLPNVLTFGELHILFSMLNFDLQQEVYTYFYPNKKGDNINITKVYRFSAILEMIRRIRNVVNHYEPILPFISSNTGKNRNFFDSTVWTALNLLRNNFESSVFEMVNNKTIDITVYPQNTKIINILSYMTDAIACSNPDLKETDNSWMRKDIVCALKEK